ncbi:hypothetical protein OROMI_014572 [Orobanche minor]
MMLRDDIVKYAFTVFFGHFLDLDMFIIFRRFYVPAETESAYLSPTMSHLSISDAIEENTASSLASCSYVWHSDSAAVSSAKNARRRTAYASINAEKRASMLLARRGAFAKRAVCPGMCRDERLQSKRERPKYHSQNSLLKRLESISTHAWCLPPVDDCRLCGDVRYLRESKGFCCLHGQISLALPQMPLELWNLYTSTTSPAAVHFRKRCRTYNNTTAFSSLGITYDHTLAQSNKGIYTLRVQGAVYHFIRSPIPHEGQGRQLQLYFYDTEHEMHNRLSQSGNLDLHILEDIVEMMKLNPYASFFRSLRELPNLRDYTIVLRADPCLDMRIYSMPTTHQVAAIWNELTDVPIDHPHDIRVCTSAGKTHRLHYYYGCYDPLQYPLLFPYGESGWHTGIEKLTPLDIGHEVRRYTRCAGHQAISLDKEHCGESILAQELQSNCSGRDLEANRWKRNNVAAREFYCYLFQIRANDATNILRAGRLVQQYQIDYYVKIETQRLDYFRSEQVQRDLRIESFEGIIESMACDGNLSGEKIGQKFVLPSSYIGSPRDMQRRYLNALALVSEYGKPDFFITVTCNPNWPEIREGLLPGEEAQNRSDLVARIFRARNEEFKNEIVTKKLLGEVAAYLYVIEFQKRGLPHAHWIIILRPHFKIVSAAAYDRFVSAEIPDIILHPHLHSCVVRHMMHGPCVLLNPSNVCMRDRKCKNWYPKDFVDCTSQHDDSYPMYRRRNDGRTVSVHHQMLDNRWVVPYNPYLLAKFDCHINVEICVGIKLIKYLYKYVCKGTNKIAFNVVQVFEISSRDEITDFQSARWLCAPEAMWRIYAFVLSEIYPPVLQLHVHLPNKHHVLFSPSRFLPEVKANPNASKTQLTEFFRMNAESATVSAMNLLYKDFPRFFVWDASQKNWHRRLKGTCIGRLVHASPTDGERYYLRLLLTHVRAPTSFDYLKTYNSVLYSTFRAAAL